MDGTKNIDDNKKAVAQQQQQQQQFKAEESQKLDTKTLNNAGTLFPSKQFAQKSLAHNIVPTSLLSSPNKPNGNNVHVAESKQHVDDKLAAAAAGPHISVPTTKNAVISPMPKPVPADNKVNTDNFFFFHIFMFSQQFSALPRCHCPGRKCRCRHRHLVKGEVLSWILVIPIFP